MNIQTLGIENKEGKMVVSSRTVAEKVGREHSKVIRTLNDKATKPEVASSIISSSYMDKKGELRKEYLLTKRGFMLYMFSINGFDELKLAYIDKFDEMEKELTSTTIPQTYGEALKLAYEQQLVIEEQQQKLIEQKPLVDFAETIASSTDTILIRELAKIVNDEDIPMGQNRLYDWLRSNGIMMKGKTEPYQSYIDSGYFEIREGVANTPYGSKITKTTMVTPKGQMFIIEKLRRELK